MGRSKSIEGENGGGGAEKFRDETGEWRIQNQEGNGREGGECGLDLDGEGEGEGSGNPSEMCEMRCEKWSISDRFWTVFGVPRGVFAGHFAFLPQKAAGFGVKAFGCKGLGV
jgi:hypothetical protein